MEEGAPRGDGSAIEGCSPALTCLLLDSTFSPLHRLYVLLCSACEERSRTSFPIHPLPVAKDAIWGTNGIVKAKVRGVYLKTLHTKSPRERLCRLRHLYLPRFHTSNYSFDYLCLQPWCAESICSSTCALQALKTECTSDCRVGIQTV